MGGVVPDICCDFALTTLLSTDPDSAVPGRDYPMTHLSSEVRSGGRGGEGSGVEIGIKAEGVLTAMLKEVEG